jgi:hypothetical protein
MVNLKMIRRRVMEKKVPNLYEGLSYVKNEVNWGIEPMPPMSERHFYDLIKDCCRRYLPA